MTTTNTTTNTKRRAPDMLDALTAGKNDGIRGVLAYETWARYGDSVLDVYLDAYTNARKGEEE